MHVLARIIRRRVVPDHREAIVVKLNDKSVNRFRREVISAGGRNRQGFMENEGAEFRLSLYHRFKYRTLFKQYCYGLLNLYKVLIHS